MLGFSCNYRVLPVDVSRASQCSLLLPGVDPLAGRREGSSGDDGGGGLRRRVLCNPAGANPGPEDRHSDRAEG